MTNVAFAIDEQTLRLARLHALEQGTSVNALVREYLEGLVRESDPSRKAGRKVVARAKRFAARSGPRGAQLATRRTLRLLSVFLDTNSIVDAHDGADRAKQATAQGLIAAGWMGHQH